MNNLHSSQILSNESKGVLLGIILFISKHLTKLSGLVVQINLSQYIKPLTKLFKNINWIGPGNQTNSKPDFTISIGSQKLGDLNISPIDSIGQHVFTKKIYLLPYYSPDNPLILWKNSSDSKSKTQDLKKIKSQIINFSLKSRQWDIQMEKKILELYFSRTNVFVYKSDLAKYFASLYAQTIIKKKKQIGSLPIPNYMPNFIPIIFSTGYRQQIEQIKEMIEKKYNKYKNLGQGPGLDQGPGQGPGPEKVIIQEVQPEPTNLNLNKEIDDLRKIIEVLNQSFLSLEENNRSALGYQETNFNPNELRGGGINNLIPGSKKLVKLLKKATKLESKLVKQNDKIKSSTNYTN